MKKYKVEALVNGRSRAIQVEGVQNIPEAVQVAEAILNGLYALNADIRSVYEVYK